MIKFLVEKGANVRGRDSERSTALHWAAKEGNVEAVRELVDMGAEVDEKDAHGLAPLSWAIFKRQSGAVKALVEKGADVGIVVEEDGCTPLHIAAAKGMVEAVTFLIENGAKVGERDRAGFAALHWAVGGPDGGCKGLVRLGEETDLERLRCTSLRVMVSSAQELARMGVPLAL